MNDFDELGDTISVEIDKRKIQELIDKGIITPEELQNAEIVEIEEPDEP